MRIEEKMNKAVALLKRHYYGHFIFLALLFLLVLFRVVPLLSDTPLINITLERYVIMISIIAIPLSLKHFADRLKKLPRPLDSDVAVRRYQNVFYLRLYTISAVTFMHILLFGFSRNTNYLWFAVVLLIVFLYCKPSYPELAGLTEAPGVVKSGENIPHNLSEDEETAGK